MSTTTRLLRSLFFYLSAITIATPAQASRLVNVTVPSTVLSAFWKRPITLHADVLLPDSYGKDATDRYPAIYWFIGFADNYDDRARLTWGNWARAMSRLHREAIVVFPNPVFNDVYTEFADSANNGPWGTAFTQELLPEINARYGVDANYVAGISSGGWAALWLQTTYPALFSGAWSYAPDPVSFRDFLGSDLTKRPLENFYGDWKNEYRTVRIGGTDRESLREFVEGKGQGMSWAPAQISSFNAVFSPAGADGPQQLFDVKTGDINAAVADYWEQHYDIASRVLNEPEPQRDLLIGRIHVAVGSWDTYHLDGPTKLFCYALYNDGLHPDCVLADETNHADVLLLDGGYAHHVLEGIFGDAKVLR